MTISHLKANARIGIFRLSALGDIICSLPLVAGLSQARPDLSITWIIDRSFYPAVSGLTNIDFLPINKPRNLGDYWRLYQVFKPYRFDYLLAMQASWRAHLLYMLIKADVKIGFNPSIAKDKHAYFVDKTIAEVPAHLIDRFLAFGRYLGVDLPADYPDGLPICQQALTWAQQQLPTQPILIVHPQASKPERNWLAARYAAVCETLSKQYGVFCVLTGGSAPGEAAFAAEIVAKINHPVLNLVGKTSLPQFIALFKCAQAVLAPDTAAVHIANALSIPVVGLYAVIGASLSGPYHQQTRVVDKYPEAVERYLQRSVATVGSGTRVHHPQAMSLIEVPEVLAKLTPLFAT